MTATAVPADEARHYGRLAKEVLVKAGVTIARSEYLLLVDRDPNIQALFLFSRAADGESQLVGASPVSTGQPGSFDHFETPVGVFEHTTANPDFCAEGTRNSQGIRGYGVKGMRVYDFGWQQVTRGWGDGAVNEMRLQMHVTDPDFLERRLGSAQSKGCIRIPASLNRLINRYGVLDAEYKRDRYTPQAITRTTTSWPKACGTGFEMPRNCHPDETMVITKMEAGNA